MRAPVILILLLTITTCITTHGQQRNSTTTVPLPTTAAAGTVTLSLSEYNRLIELSTRKTTSPDAAPLPFVLSRAVFKLRVENQTLRGSVNIDGTSLLKGPVKAPLVTGLTVVQAEQAGSPLPLLLEGAGGGAVLSGGGRVGRWVGCAW